MLKLGWFSSGGEGSRFLLESVLLNKPNDVHIKWVFMNKDVDEDVNAYKYAQLVESAGIRLFTLSWKKHWNKRHYTINDEKKEKWYRKDYDWQVSQIILDNWDVLPDYVFMVGYMRIITKELLSRFKFVNLHPGLPDGYKGTYKQVIEKLKKKAKGGPITTGSMTHYVDEGVDTGKPIMFFRFTCHAEYDIIRKQTLTREPYLLLKTIEYLNLPIEVLNANISSI